MTDPDLRALLREIPAPVAVVTVELADEAAGLTVDSFVSLSLAAAPLRRRSPPGCRPARSCSDEAGAFAVSILASEQEHLAQHFARGVPPIAHWTGIEATPGPAGAPLLAGALGWIECAPGLRA